ncbi:MAG: DUF2378 family protein [Acidobacteriota bacterium]
MTSSGPHDGPKIKGTGLQSVVSALRQRRDHAEPLLPEGLRHYLDDRLLVASWYPEEDYYGLLRALAHFAPKAVRDAWDWMGATSARGDLSGIYAAMVQRNNPWATLQRLPRLWSLYHDTGRVDVGFQGEGRSQVLVWDYSFAHEHFCRLKGGYLRVMLELAGAADPRVKVLRAGTAGHPARWLISWTE